MSFTICLFIADESYLTFHGLGICVYASSFAQTSKDTLKTRDVKEVIIRKWQRQDITQLPEEQNGFLNSGKSEVLNIANTNANMALKTPRQLFSKVPGAFVYDMDGSGNQVNISTRISTRGLDPHRGWENYLTDFCMIYWLLANCLDESWSE